MFCKLHSTYLTQLNSEKNIRSSQTVKMKRYRGLKNRILTVDSYNSNLKFLQNLSSMPAKYFLMFLYFFPKHLR